jgi:hypothetical protein
MSCVLSSNHVDMGARIQKLMAAKLTMAVTDTQKLCRMLCLCHAGGAQRSQKSNSPVTTCAVQVLGAQCRHMRKCM